MSVHSKPDSDTNSGSSSSLVVKQEIVNHISEISKNSRTTFFALVLGCVYSYLTISTTNDAALLTNSGAIPLPIIQVRVSITWFYYFAPAILTVLFFYFHLYLESFWRSIVSLPLYHHQDKRGLDDYIYPWLISTTFIRGANPTLAKDRPLSLFGYVLSVLLGWWLIPFLLLVYWGRYLTAHEWLGTIIHSVLLLLTVGFAFRFYYLAKNAVSDIPSTSDTVDYESRNEHKILYLKTSQIVLSVVVTLMLTLLIAYFSLSAMYGLPKDVCNDVSREKSCIIFIPGTEILTWIGVEPFANIQEKRIVDKPKNWLDLLARPDHLDRYLETQSNLKLSERNLRRLNGQNAFLPASLLDRIILDYAELQHATLVRSKLMNVSFHGANLTHIDFQHAFISSTIFENVIAETSRFNNVRFITGKNGEYTHFSGEYFGAWFESCYGDNLRFMDADLRETHFKRAKIGFSDFKRVNLAGAALDEAEFSNSTFYQTNFINVAMTDADLSYSSFEECKFFSRTISGAIFEDVTFINSEFDNLEANPTEPVAEQGSIKFNTLDSIYGFGMKFKGGEIRNVHFINGDLRFARFEEVTFSNSRFSNTDLSGAIFIGTDLSDVVFENVDFSGADLANVVGLTATHMHNMCGNKETILPENFEEIEPCVDEDAKLIQ